MNDDDEKELGLGLMQKIVFGATHCGRVAGIRISSDREKT
jgi:hypothetical protein